MYWAIGGGVLLLAVAAASLWFALQRPEIIARLGAIVAKAVFKAVAPKVAPRDLTDEEKQAVREGREPFPQRGGKGPSSK